MTTTLDRPVASASRHNRITLRRVVVSEWIKFRTLRSSWITLLSAVAVMIVLSLVIGYNTGKNFGSLAPEDAAPSGGLQGFLLAQLLVGVLGVLFVSDDHGTGMIRSTLAAVQRRVPVLVAKAVVFGGVALVSMVSASFAAFFCAQAFLSHYGHGTSLGSPGVLRVVIGTGVYLSLVGLLAGAIGWIVRSTAGSISAYVGLLLVLPPVIGLLPGSLSKQVAYRLPGAAGESFISSVHTSGSLSPWAGLGVLVLWVVCAFGAAVVVLRRRDA